MSRIKKYIAEYRITILISVLILFILESISSIAYFQLKKPTHYLWSSTLQALELLKHGRVTSRSDYDKIVEINNSRKIGKQLYPNYLTEPQFHDPSEPYFLANVTNSEIVGCNESGYFNRWVSDFYGFRNPTDINKSQADVLLIGDSFTVGDCENESGTIAGYLRSRGYKVANLGKSGSGPLFQLATLVEYASVYKAKTVVWVIFTGNDLYNLREEKTTKLAKYLEEDFKQDLVDRKVEVNNKLKDFLNEEIRNGNLRMEKNLPLIKTNGKGESLDLLDAKRKEATLFLEVASRFLSVIKKENSALKVVILNHINYDHSIQDVTSEVMKTFAASESLDYLEFSREYLKVNNNYYTKNGPHFNEQGYKSIGEEINMWLREGGTKRL